MASKPIGFLLKSCSWEQKGRTFSMSRNKKGKRMLSLLQETQERLSI